MSPSEGNEEGDVSDYDYRDDVEDAELVDSDGDAKNDLAEQIADEAAAEAEALSVWHDRNVELC